MVAMHKIGVVTVAFFFLVNIFQRQQDSNKFSVDGPSANIWGCIVFAGDSKIFVCVCLSV